MAVIPDNRDRELMVSAPGVDDFWNSVRSWQKRGWTVGLHDSLTPSLFLDRINPI